MVTKMNKKEFINELSKRINYSYEKCAIINDVLEDNFVISKKSKENIIKQLNLQLEVDNEEAEMIYNTSILIINEEIKNKLKHPFKLK